MKTFKATLRNHGVGSNSSMILVGETEKDAIKEYYTRKCEGAEVLSITEPYAQGSYHVEHAGRMTYVHRGNRGEGHETVYNDSFSDFKEVN